MRDRTMAVQFDMSEFYHAIYAGGPEREYSQFIGRKDLRSVEIERNLSGEQSEDRDYDSFGETEEIDF